MESKMGATCAGNSCSTKRWLLRSYTFLLLLAAASWRLPHCTALELTFWILVISVPAMMATWHNSFVRRLLSLHQLHSQLWLHRWLTGRFISLLANAVPALVLAALVVLQSPYWGTVEWSLLGAMPLFHNLLWRWMDGRMRHQFSAPLYAHRWIANSAERVLVVVMLVSWIVLSWLSSSQANSVLAQVSTIQSQWTGVTSGIVKWGLDAGAWSQAITGALANTSEESSASWWHLALALLVAPASVFGFVALSLTGAILPAAEWRRVMSSGLSIVETPPPLGAGRTAAWAALSVVGIMALFQIMAFLESRADERHNPLLVRAVPDCESIGGVTYRVSTVDAVSAFLQDANGSLVGLHAASCKGLSTILAEAEQPVDAYLDWYYSLTADWMRTLAMLTGGVDSLLANKFNEVVLSDARLSAVANGVQQDYMKQWSQMVATQAGAWELLTRNQLGIATSQCNVVKRLDANPLLENIQAHHTRLAASAGAGLVAGTFAAGVTSKVAAKLTLKSAGKMFMKASSKKLFSKGGLAVLGAAIGSIVPGAGTELPPEFRLPRADG